MSTRPRPEQLAWHRLFGALFISGAIIGLVGNGLHPHTADLDGAATEDLSIYDDPEVQHGFVHKTADGNCAAGLMLEGDRKSVV